MGNFLIIAGMPCSGKSTLLRQSLQAKSPLFGADDDYIFQSTRTPSLDAENSISTQERIHKNYWLHEIDLIHAKLAKISLTSHVIHFDIYWFYIIVLMNKLKISKFKPRELELIYSITMRKENITKTFDLFQIFVEPRSEFSIKLLEIDYEEICNRWSHRLSSIDATHLPEHRLLSEKIYNKTPEGKAIYLDFNNSFKESLRLL